jgi:hypothetical protein
MELIFSWLESPLNQVLGSGTRNKNAQTNVKPFLAAVMVMKSSSINDATSTRRTIIVVRV